MKKAGSRMGRNPLGRGRPDWRLALPWLARIALALLVSVTQPAASEASRARTAIVERVEWEVSDTGARVVVVVKGKVNFSTHTVGAGPGLPPRAYVDLNPARLGAAISREPIEVADRLLQRIRIGQFDQNTARIVVDLAEPAFFHVATAEGPTRLILKLVPPRERIDDRSPAAARAERLARTQPRSSRGSTPPLPEDRRPAAVLPPSDGGQKARGRRAAPSPTPVGPPIGAPSTKVAEGEAAEPSPVPRRLTVVLDPGHGGRDPGARGVGGDLEKSVTLAIARDVAARLRERSEIDVHLTRDNDEAVSLESRTALANARNADLFVSIHANASKNSRTSGIETYTLNNTDDQATMRLAALENGLSFTGVKPEESDLAFILSDLLQTGKEGESTALAEAVQSSLVRYLRKRWRGIDDLGVKKGPFYVLVGAYMPCILIEVGFLTHPTEGQRIGSRRYQKDLAEGIALGIEQFLAVEAPVGNL